MAVKDIDEITDEKVNGLAGWRQNATPEQKAEAARKSSETRARKKSMREVATFILQADLPDDEGEVGELLDLIGAERTYQDAMLFNIARKAVNNADVEAARFIRDTSGQKPTDQMAIGNLGDSPLDINLSSLSDAELLHMIEDRE